MTEKDPNNIRKEGSCMTISNRGKDWMVFAEKVLSHIENYTVPQYGDAPDDQVEEWDAQDCTTTIRRYASRSGKNQRSGQDKLDMLKTAHYAQLAYNKLPTNPK